MMNGSQVLTELFGVFGPYIILALIFILLMDKLAKFITGFKRFKVGNAVVGIETEALGGQDMAETCPHRSCSEARDKVLTDLTESMAELRQSNVTVTKMIQELEEKVNTVHTDIQAVYTKIDDVSIDQLKLVFYNKEMTYAERIISGLKYIVKGHNRQFKTDAIEEIVKHPDVYTAIITTMPSLRCEEIDNILHEEGL